MEAEERPSKIRKVDQSNGNEKGEEEISIMQEDHGITESLPKDSQDSDQRALSEFDGEVFQNSPIIDRTRPQQEASLSKSQLKKLKRQQEWEAGREERKAWKKEKRHESKKRKREAREAQKEERVKASEEDGSASVEIEAPRKERPPRPVQLPITFMLDCGFDELMTDKERISLASQVTRCYSDNYKAPFRPHLAICSFGGSLKDRFEKTLSGHYRKWKNVRFYEQDFVHASKEAEKFMSGPSGGKLAGALSEDTNDQSQAVPGETVYLTSESPNELSRLKPHSTYIIGGLVDRNRHKGICYRRAMDHGVQTARLPIGKYMSMLSRFVLATNHVNEIMLKWLSNGDWGRSMLEVMPKRKQGVLKEPAAGESSKNGGKDGIQEDDQGSEDAES